MVDTCDEKDCPGHDHKPLYSVAHSEHLLVEKGNRVKDDLVDAVLQVFEEDNDVHNLALNLSAYTEISTGLIRRLQGDIERLKDENAGLRLGSQRFTCFGRLPAEIRAMIWKLAATESYTPKIFQVDVERLTRVDGGPEYSVRYPRHNVAQVCKESRYLLHPLKAEDHDWETMSDEHKELVRKGMSWGWDGGRGWPWFQSTQDGIFLSGAMLDTDEATGEEALKSLEKLVGPVRRVLVPWRENLHGDDLELGSGILSKFKCLQHLRSFEFVMTRRRVKRDMRAYWPMLPITVDVEDPDAVAEAMNVLGDDAAFFRRDVCYFAERDYILEDAGPAEYWNIFHKCIQEDWLLWKSETDPPEADDYSPIVEREVVDWGHPWVRKQLNNIPEFKRVIMLE